MRAYLAVVENLFWDLLDRKSFWIFLVPTVICGLLPLLVGFKEFSDREKEKEAIKNVLRFGQSDSFSNWDRESLPGGGASYTVDFEISPPGGIGPMILPGLQPERLKDIGEKTGVRNLNFSDAELTISRGDLAETVQLSTADLNQLDPEKAGLGQSDMIGDRFPEVIQNKFEKDEITNLFSKRTWRDLSEEVNLTFSARISYEVKSGDVVATKVLLPGTDEEWKQPMSTTDLVTRIQHLMINYIAGWGGVIIAIIITSNIVPSMFEEGTVELHFTKGTPRWTVFLGYFTGAGMFFGLLTFVFIFLSTICFSLRAGVHNYHLLLTILPLVLMYFVVYAMAAFLGVLLENGIVGIVGSLFGWVCLYVVRGGQETINKYLPSGSEDVVEFLSTILPSPGELKILTWRLIERYVELSPMMKSQLPSEPETTLQIFLSSFGFILVFVVASIAVLYRKEF